MLGYTEERTFKVGWEFVSEAVYKNACDKGFWNNDRNNGEMIALMHSELSEALEADRKSASGNASGSEAGTFMDDKLPDRSGVEVELADAVIRIMDFGYARGLDIAGAILAKMEYNETRPYMHGGKKY